jgi:hypothetical protein
MFLRNVEKICRYHMRSQSACRENLHLYRNPKKEKIMCITSVGKKSLKEDSAIVYTFLKCAEGRNKSHTNN